METDITYFIKMNSKIFRNTQVYLDKVLKKFELSSGNFRYLFILNDHEGLSQNQISKAMGHDKAMSARTINRLIEQGFLSKTSDPMDSRAYKLYLTDKARTVIPKVKIEIDQLIDLITEGLSDDEKRNMMGGMAHVFDNTQRLSGRGGE